MRINLNKRNNYFGIQVEVEMQNTGMIDYNTGFPLKDCGNDNLDILENR
ncbi:hypothetical protein ACFL67_02205 [candidate division KSB1 bacterium]